MELVKDPKFVAGDYKAALINTFLRMDVLLDSEGGRKEVSKITEEVAASKAADPSQSQGPSLMEDDGEGGVEMKGCTANVVLIKDRKLFIANAGDSRSIAVMADGKVEELSVDHKPDREPEISRIIKAGGSVMNGRVEGNLNLSRALGDLHYKANKALKPEEQMICSYPDVVVKDLTDDLSFLVMGCDGVYEIKNSQEIGTFVHTEAKAAPEKKLTEVVEKLLEAIISPDYMKTSGAGCDNMTCIVVRFKHPGKGSA